MMIVVHKKIPLSTVQYLLARYIPLLCCSPHTEVTSVGFTIEPLFVTAAHLVRSELS